MAQGSMSKIANCLTSRMSQSMTESQLRQDTSVASEFDTSRLQTRNLNSTKKELKNLMKIQRKHSKLLEKLQKNGIVDKNSGNAESEITMTLLEQMQSVFKQLSII